jgi:ribosomal-protein-alanine N-acetyltransferase
VRSATTPLRRADLTVRPARDNDGPALHHLVEASARVHLHLDWWTLEDWIGNPACLVAEADRRIVGLGMGVRDASDVAWLRAVVMEGGLGVNVLLDVLLPPLLAALRSQGIRQLACMAWANWLSDKLAEHGFSPLTHVVTLVQNDATFPRHPSVNGILLREAESADVDTITSLDHAAFSTEWWYSGTTFFRAMHDRTHFIMAERNGLLAGYGFGHAFGVQAHITRLAVHPEQQGQGLGTRLLEALIMHFRARGAETITLNTQADNQDALRLYDHFGFTSAGDVVTVWRTFL